MARLTTAVALAALLASLPHTISLFADAGAAGEIALPLVRRRRTRHNFSPRRSSAS